MFKIKINRNSNFILIWILAFMSALAPLATDMYLPSLENIQYDLATNSSLMQLSITVFFIAFAFGQLLYGPISDAYGRTKPLYIGIALYTIASLACGLCHSVYSFIFWRFLQALGGCSGVVIARAIINDKFDVREGASILAIMMMISSLAPMLAPSVGGIITKIASWEFIFILLFVFGIMLLCMMFFGLQETHARDKSVKFDIVSVLQNYFSITKDRRYMIFVMTFSLILAPIFAYITAASFIFQKYYGLSEQQFAILFGVNTIGSTVSSIINAKIVRQISPYSILSKALVIMICFSLLMLTVAYFDLGFILFEVFLFLTMAMIGFIAPNATVLAMARFKHKSGAASGLLGMIQFVVAGFISFLVGVFSANTPLSLSIIMAGSIFSGWVVYLLLNRRMLIKLKRRIIKLRARI